MVASAKGEWLSCFPAMAILAVGLLGAVAPLRAEGEIVPPWVKVIDAEGLITLARSHSDLLIIDSRIERDRDMGYIEDSISLNDDQTSCKTLAAASGARMERPLVFYCNGFKCIRSYRALLKADDCGYKRIFWFRGGYEEWREKGLPVLRPHW